MDPADAPAATGGSGPPRQRDGRSPLERLAVARMAADAAAMPASEIVQLVLWPETVAHWARDAGISTAVAYNMLSRFKPYRRVRELLARRLDVPGFVLDHLVDAARPLPSVLRAPAASDSADEVEPPTPPRGDAISPTVRLPAQRDGSNPLEQRATWRVWHDAAALPASVIVQLALFPETLAEWARRKRLPPSSLYALLAGTQPHPGARELLAQRLGVPTWALSQLLDRPRREPVQPAPRSLAESPEWHPGDEGERSDASPTAERPLEPPAPPGDQLTLGF